MADLYELHERPDLDDPVLLVALDGWIDAGYAAGRAVETMIAQSDSTLVATFDADVLLDFRARRPIMHLVDGVNTGLTWSTTELHALRSPNGTGILLLHGVEPDHAWLSFADAVRDLAVELGTRMQLGFGAYPAGTPHTRPVALSATASDEDLAASIDLVRGTIDVPAGVEAVLEQRFADAGLAAMGIWAQVPHYAATMRYPAASARLIEAFNELAGTDYSVDPLADDVAETRQHIDSLIEANPEHVAMLRQLEEQADEAAQNQLSDLPSGEDLAEELQRFLREQGD
jgi:predicted ATP-grasp superfamily ATP-dependent carboligase